MNTLKALIFDVDGTLADTEEIHRLAFNRAFIQAGIPWEWSVQLYGRLLAVTGGKERIRHYVSTYQPEFVPEERLAAIAAELHKTKTAIYTQMLRGGEIRLRPGVERILSEAREQGMKLAIATTTTLANVEALIDNALHPGAMQWFDVVGAGDAVPRKKPEPDIYHYVLDRLQLAAPQCIAFEDSENGIQAARAAGLKTIITVNQYTQDHDFKGAAIVLDQMGEPGSPYTLISGNGFGHNYMDMELVKKLHSAG